MYPKVTVLMSVYNGERFLRESMESILKQTLHDFEFMIINDGSTDDTQGILNSYQDSRIKIVVNERNIGLTGSLNKGLALACGQYIARMDADDISYPGRLERQLVFMQNNPETAVLGTQTDYIDHKGRPLKVFAPNRPVSPLATKYAIIFGSPVSHPTVMFQKNIIVNKLGGYDPTYMVGQDADLWIRASKDHVIRNLSDKMLTMRIVSGSVSYSPNHPRRANHVKQWVKRRQEVMKRVLGEDAVPDEWGEWWELLRRSHTFIDKKAALELLRNFNIIQELFVKKYPNAQGNEEIVRLTADCKARVALYLVEHSRWNSIPAFYQASRMSRTIASLYAPKYLGLLMLGQSAKFLYRSFNRYFRKDILYKACNVLQQEQRLTVARKRALSLQASGLFFPDHTEDEICQ